MLRNFGVWLPIFSDLWLRAQEYLLRIRAWFCFSSLASNIFAKVSTRTVEEYGFVVKISRSRLRSRYFRLEASIYSLPILSGLASDAQYYLVELDMQYSLLGCCTQGFRIW